MIKIIKSILFDSTVNTDQDRKLDLVKPKDICVDSCRGDSSGQSSCCWKMFPWLMIVMIQVLVTWLYKQQNSSLNTILCCIYQHWQQLKYVNFMTPLPAKLSINNDSSDKTMMEQEVENYGENKSLTDLRKNSVWHVYIVHCVCVWMNKNYPKTRVIVAAYWPWL